MGLTFGVQIWLLHIKIVPIVTDAFMIFLKKEVTGHLLLVYEDERQIAEQIFYGNIVNLPLSCYTVPADKKKWQKGANCPFSFPVSDGSSFSFPAKVPSEFQSPYLRDDSLRKPSTFRAPLRLALLASHSGAVPALVVTAHHCPTDAPKILILEFLL